MSFEAQLENKIKQTEQLIYQFLPEETGFQKRLFEAMNYSMKAGGKRIRPLLMRETYLLCGGKEEKVVYPFMAAMEMIHTYSLIHDDLPAMDDDDLRRGKPTTHKAFDEATAILAGDGLLNYAFETACKAADVTSDTVSVFRALRVLATKPGIYGMVGGQAVDVENENRKIEKDMLDFIYRLKTGALIEASMMIGAILAGADEDEVKKIEGIAADIGLAFQIQDDILDVVSTTEVLGKPVNSDEKNNKCTYVTYEGIEQSQKDVVFYSERAIGQLHQFGNTNEFLEELVKYLIHREK
ncbi:MAG: polyprenyl synthetase family protein [Lachnospiraceae bacterium]|nr:polyprenyl synthetase family protein [Lachnospiraceae bacterium]